MIQAKDLSPDSRRLTFTINKVKGVSQPFDPITAFHTHTQRYRVTRIVVEVLVAVTSTDWSVGVFKMTDATSQGTLVCGATLVAGSSPVGTYVFEPGGLAAIQTLPFILDANKSFYVFGSYIPGGGGAAVISVDLEPVDDNPQ